MHKKTFFGLVSIIACLGLAISGCDYLDTLKVKQAAFVGKSVAAADCNYGGEISAVRAVDEYTVVFELCQPDAAFAAKMAAPIFAVQDEATLAATGGDPALLSQAPVGTGAYRLSAWQHGELLSLQPSTSYWGVPGVPSTIEFLWRLSASQRYSFTTYTTVDGLDIPPASLIASIRSNDSIAPVQHPFSNLYYIGFNNTIAPLDKLEVRKAIALALDRSAIVLQTFPLGSDLAQQMVPANFAPGYSENLSWYAQNVAEARSQLTAAGFDFNQPITLAVAQESMGYLESPQNAAVLVMSQLEAIGIKVTLKLMPLAELQEAINSGSEMAYLYWFQADYADASAYFEAPFVTNAAQLGTAYPEIQSAVKATLASADNDSRQAAFDQLNALVKDQVPLIPLGNAAFVSVFRKTVNNVAVNGYYENFEEMTSTDTEMRYTGVSEPLSLWPADEDDYQTFRITRLLYDTLLMPGFGDEDFKPLLAESWESNASLTQWTFHLRYNVRFSNNVSFDANDVVASFAAIWDAKDPNHKGRTGEFAYYRRLFGNLLNE
jgi:ABC-type transport system substrate-binding protein